MTKKLCDVCRGGFVEERPAKYWVIDHLKGGIRLVHVCAHHTWLYVPGNIFATKKKAQEELLKRSL